jgi:hypothetical protein
MTEIGDLTYEVLTMNNRLDLTERDANLTLGVVNIVKENASKFLAARAVRKLSEGAGLTGSTRAALVGGADSEIGVLLEPASVPLVIKIIAVLAPESGFSGKTLEGQPWSDVANGVKVRVVGGIRIGDHLELEVRQRGDSRRVGLYIRESGVGGREN